MARQPSPVHASALAADHATVMALQSLSDYQPVNPAYSIEQLLQLQVALAQADQATKAVEVSLAQARVALAEAARAYHNAVVGARAHVIAQYGPDATAVALVGLTRKSQRKRPTRRQPAAQ